MVHMSDLVEEELDVAGDRLRLLRPRRPDDLLDEHAFAQDEFLPYWADLWPSAGALAAVLAGRDLRGVRMLELGCGLGVPSLVAAQRGAAVLATDWAPAAIDLLRRNARRNGVELEGRVWRWDSEAPGPPWPLVVASDVLYERRNERLLRGALERVLAPGGEALVADPGRRFAAGLLAPAEVVAREGPVTVFRLTA